MRRSALVLALATAVLALTAAPALAVPKLAPGTLNLSGTPTGSGTLEKDISANFFLTVKVLGKNVSVTIDGHKASQLPRLAAVPVGNRLLQRKLHFGKRYRVVIVACSKLGCSRAVRDKTLPKPSL